MLCSILVFQSLLWTTVLSCLSNEIPCKNGNCTTKMFLCDGDDDCGNGSDELEEICNNQEDVCPHRYIRCGTSSFCYYNERHCNGKADCPDGSDEKLCSNADCEPYETRCPHGPCVDHPDACCELEKGLCKINQSESDALSKTFSKSLIYTDGRKIHRLRLDDNNIQLLEESGDDKWDIEALAYSAARDTVFWTAGPEVWEMKLNASGKIQKQLLGVIDENCSISNMSYDWITKNFYFVCDNNQIIVCNSNTNATSMLCAELATFEHSDITSLNLHPSNGSMFIGRQADHGFQLLNFAMDGSFSGPIYEQYFDNSTHFVNIDNNKNKIFICDFAHIRAVEFSGQEAVGDAIYFPDECTALFSDVAIITNAEEFYPMFFRDNRLTFKRLNGVSNAREFVLFDVEAQPTGTDYCKDLRCDHLCLLRPGGSVCGCDSKYKLMEDKRSCQMKDTGNNSSLTLSEAPAVSPSSDS